jgi:glycosyltransferase involved in cell wall biosynthesis
MTVAIVHDYLTQRGGAERVVLSMLKAFPDAPLYTSLFDPTGTFPEFSSADVRTLSLDAIRPLRRHHRLAFPLLAPAFSRTRLDADIVLCSSSGWAHGVRTGGRKVVYCHAPARWLYQPLEYLGAGRQFARGALGALRPALVAWDRWAAGSADTYLANSRAVAERIREAYGIDAMLLPPAHTLGQDGPARRVDRLSPGFLLCVSRLLPYKNLEPLLEALRLCPELSLVIVGTGPTGRRLADVAPPNVHFIGAVSDEQLRWLYAACSGLVAASEDFGLTPLEAAAFGKPSAVLRWGGFLDTVVEGRTGLFFDRPEAQLIAPAVEALAGGRFDSEDLRRHADQFSEPRFVERLRAVVLGRPCADASGDAEPAAAPSARSAQGGSN